MRPASQALGGAALCAVALGLGVSADRLGHELGASTVPALATTPARVVSMNLACVEDDPCWTWSRMGNRRRGVLDLASGRRVVVGPCAFRTLWMNGDADLRGADQRMRGDWWAIHHGCESSERLDRPAVHPSGVVEG